MTDKVQKIKECMFTKDYYTDEDRKSLCDGCEEKCKYDKSDDFTKALAECIHNAQCNVVDPMVFAEIWKDELIKLSKCEEPVSEDLEAEVKKLWEEINTGHSYSIVDSYNIFYGLCMDIAEWQKQKDANLIFNAKEDGYRLGFATMKQQLMAKAVDVTIAIPYQNGYGGYTQLVDSKETLPFGENLKILVIKDD